MLKIVTESNDILNEFVIHLPIYLLPQTNNQLSMAEDWSFDSNLLMLPNKADFITTEQGKILVKTFLDSAAVPNLDKILDYYNHITPYMYSKGTTYTGKTGKCKNTLDISYYLPINCDLISINCSTNVLKSLSNFTIRVANHISKQEEKGIRAYDNVKLFHEQIVGLYEQLFIEYTNNIFRAYSNFLDKLSGYDKYIGSFDDIDMSDILDVKSIAVQGDF